MGDDSDLNLLRAEICLAPGGGECLNLTALGFSSAEIAADRESPRGRSTSAFETLARAFKVRRRVHAVVHAIAMACIRPAAYSAIEFRPGPCSICCSRISTRFQGR
jgi:hypothetical protein